MTTMKTDYEPHDGTGVGSGWYTLFGAGLGAGLAMVRALKGDWGFGGGDTYSNNDPKGYGLGFGIAEGCGSRNGLGYGAGEVNDDENGL